MFNRFWYGTWSAILGGFVVDNVYQHDWAWLVIDLIILVLNIMALIVDDRSRR